MSCHRRQAGATAVEFALILPVFLLMSYGMVVYAYMFVLQESLTYAAQEAAEAAVKVDPTLPSGDYSAAVESEARAAATRVLDYLPEDQKQRVLGEGGANVQVSIGPSPSGVGGIVTVDLSFNFDGLFPELSLPGLGDVPPMPDSLNATAVAGI